jgi:hypothetical protein
VTVVDLSPNSLVPSAASVAGLAEMFVATRRVVPGLTVGDDGVARSWWWPLPSASDRGLLAVLLDGNDVDDHAGLAAELGSEVDRRMRERLLGDGVELLERRSGRRTVPDAWVRSLTALDPRLSGSLDGDRVAAFAAVVAAIDPPVNGRLWGRARGPSAPCIRKAPPLLRASSA